MGNDRPHHALEGELSVFIRWRSSFTLYIKPNIRDVLGGAVEKLKTNDHKAYFKEEIKDIGDGYGLGVHPDSTWIVALKELFGRYERDNQVLGDSTKKAIIEVFEVILEEPVETGWDKIRQKIIDNIDILSGWQRRQQYNDIYKGVKRNNDGTYSRVGDKPNQIIGITTEDESRFDYTTGTALQEYGTLHYLLKLICLVDIADNYIKHPEYFSDKMYCLLHDNRDYETGYLNWRWQIFGVYDVKPVFWRPRSCFSDPEWLAHDLLAEFSSQFERKDPEPPSVQFVASDEFTEFSKSFTREYELVLDTLIILGDKREYYFKFEDRYVRWINGDRFLSSMLIVPTNEKDGEDALKIGLRFLSVVSKFTDQAVQPYIESLSGIRQAPLLSQPRLSMMYGYDPSYMLPAENVEKYSDDKFVAVALRREATNTDSVFYKFLSFYKIIQLAFNDKTSTELNTWIDDTVSNARDGTPLKYWAENTLPSNKTAAQYLYKTNRNSIAHIKREGTDGNGLTDPDDPVDYLRVKNDIFAVRALADVAIAQL